MRINTFQLGRTLLYVLRMIDLLAFILMANMRQQILKVEIQEATQLDPSRQRETASLNSTALPYGIMGCTTVGYFHWDPVKAFPVLQLLRL